MVIKAIVFDFDGTISDAKRIAYIAVKRSLEDFDYAHKDSDLRKLMGLKMKEILVGLKLPHKFFEVQKFRRSFYKYLISAAVDGGIKRCVSMKPLYKLKKEYLFYVISNSERKFLRVSTKKLKLEGLFPMLVGHKHGKSKDDLLRDLFKKKKILPSEAVYVGDRFTDIIYARKAGCISIAIYNKCAWSTLAQIRREGPDYIISDFYGLNKVLKEIKRSKK